MQFKILLSRFLTKFGDQAWDFAVPIVLIKIFPNRIDLIALFFFLSKIINIIAGPFLLKRIDNTSRLTIYRIGITTQVIAMLFSLPILLLWMSGHNLSDGFLPLFVLLTGLHAWANLGSSLMDVAVGLDLAVDIIPTQELSLFNGKLKRLDLITEVIAPLIAGAVLALSPINFASLGVLFIALLNIFTFAPEYYLLKSVVLSSNAEKIVTPKNEKSVAFTELWRALLRLKGAPYLPVIIAYTFLWFSVLSPHGVLLTSYLKDTMNLSEFKIGLFRASGALFGVIPTFLFTPLQNHLGLLRASQVLLLSQGIFVVFAFISFGLDNISLFLTFILFSRIGLYGFSIGETEIRQRLIPLERRGEVNGIANSLTSLATLLLFLLSGLVSKSEDFTYLVAFSTFAVIAAVITIKFQRNA